MKWSMRSNKNLFCLLIITLFAVFFFARSVVVREKWMVPTWLSDYRQATATNLSYVNNWLDEGVIQLGFATYIHPRSVERPTLDKRWFYGSYPPAAIFFIYLFFKTIQITNLVPDIYNKRGTQLLMIILLNYIHHFLLVLVLCGIVFFVCRKIGFDRLNSTLFSIVPAITQFHNANSLYWHHLAYNQDTIFLLPFVLYVLLEFLRSDTHSRATRIIYIAQPVVAFIGMLTNWIFGFIILTIYIMRMMRKEVESPTSFLRVVKWVKQSFLFFVPSLVAIVLWVYQVAYYANNIAYTTFFNAGISSRNTNLTTNFLFRTGFTDGFDNIMMYIKTAFYQHVIDGYGISGMLLLYVTLITVILRYKYISKKLTLLVGMYLVFFVPCLAWHLFLPHHNAKHSHSSLMFSPALSVSFVLMPILILQIMKKPPSISIQLLGKINITVAALISLSLSIIYGYTQIYNKQSVTKMFHPPAWHFATVGTFVRKNTRYEDIVFSSDYCPRSELLSMMEAHFSGKTIYCVYNLDQIYEKTKLITSDFTIRVLYLEKYKENTYQLERFLNTSGLHTSSVEKEMLGGMLAFNGKQFLAWYERVIQSIDDGIILPPSAAELRRAN